MGFLLAFYRITFVFQDFPLFGVHAQVSYFDLFFILSTVGICVLIILVDFLFDLFLVFPEIVKSGLMAV